MNERDKFAAREFLAKDVMGLHRVKSGSYVKVAGARETPRGLPNPFDSQTDAGLLLVAMRRQEWQVRRAFAQRLEYLVENDPETTEQGKHYPWPEAVIWMKPEHIAKAVLAALEWEAR